MQINKQDLVITGNGFDINHGLDTSFRSFFEYLSPDLRAEWEMYLNKYNLPNETWYNFEEIISIITNESFNAYFDTYIGDKTETEQNLAQEKFQHEINNINQIYKNIYYEFRSFIAKKNARDVSLSTNISHIIMENTPVISFNYTNLIKQYSNNIYYIHGSSHENFIVFGYSLRTEYDYIDPEAAIYDKNKFRELLNYVRYLMEVHDIKNNNLEVFVEEYLPHVLQSSTGKGGWNIDYPESFIERCEQYLFKEYELLSYHYEYYNYLSEELKDEARFYRLKQISFELNNYYEDKILNSDKQIPYSFNINLPFNLQKVNRLIIMGHGLESDLELFREIFENSTNLNKVLLYVYSGELKIEIERKIEQLKEYTSCDIIVKKY